MAKNKSEERVGYLLKNQEHFRWAFKPADGSMYGGQTRIDWLACDRLGVFWMVEVKSAGPTQQSINLEREVSPGQRDALDSVAQSKNGVALLIVMKGNMFYVFDWRRLRTWWELRKLNDLPGSASANLFALDAAPLQIPWSNKETWQKVLPFRPAVRQLAEFASDTWPIQVMLTTPSLPSPSPAQLHLTSKPKDSTPTRRKTPR